MKLRYLVVFSVLCVLILPALSIKAQTNNPVFSARISTKASGNQDGQNITNALSISPGNTCGKELEAHETIYFCTLWQENIYCSIFSDTPKKLSFSLLSDTGETLNAKKEIENNKITVSCHNSSDNKGQYIFFKITNRKDTNQEIQLKLNNTSLNSQKKDDTPKQTVKPKSTPSTSKKISKPKSTSSTLKKTPKPLNTPSATKPTVRPQNTPSVAKQTTSPTIPPKYTAKPDNLTPDYTVSPKNTINPFPKETIIPKTASPNPSVSPESKNILSYTNNIPHLEEHFLELKLNTSYQLTVSDTDSNLNLIIWSSTNPEIVSVEQGRLEIHKTGTAIIYCQYPQTERGSSCFVYCS